MLLAPGPDVVVESWMKITAPAGSAQGRTVKTMSGVLFCDRADRLTGLAKRTLENVELVHA